MILLDTHVVLWLALAPERLSSEAARAILGNRDSGLAISDVSLYEIAVAVHRGRISLQVPLHSFLQEIQTRFMVLPVTAAIAVQAVQLPAPYPRDFIDRIIGATALIESIPLLTADEAISRARVVAVVW